MLSPEILLTAYANGYFPMAVETGEIGWFSPDPRAVLPLTAFHVPRRLRRIVQQGRFEIRVDTAFRAVIDACAAKLYVAEVGSRVTQQAIHILGGYGYLREYRLEQTYNLFRCQFGPSKTSPQNLHYL